MVRKKRNPSRNRNGGYDLSAAESATPRRGRSRSGSRGGTSHSRAGQTGSLRSRRSGREADKSPAEAPVTGPETLEAARAAEETAKNRRAMKEAATLAAAHIAAKERAQAERDRALSAANPHHARAAAPDSSAQSAPIHRTAHTEEHIEVGYSSPEDTGRLSREAASYSADRYKARKHRMSKGKKAAIAVVSVLVVALVGAGAAFGLWYSGIVGNLGGSDKISVASGSDNGEPYYVLLLGGDSRSDDPTDDYGNRSDSIMVARVDEANKNVSLLSIPRDTRVNIDGHGSQKINAAIEFGGYDAVASEVNELLGIQINYYAFIYFDGFEELVDKLGGVTVAVPEGTYYNGVSVPAGDAVEINGEEALVLARCRHGNPPDQGAYAMGDYQRTLNQRNLIKAIAKKVLQQDAAKLPDLMTSLSECLETNMSAEKLISLAQNMKGFKVSKIKADTLPYAGASIDGAWYAILYEDVFEDVKKNFQAGEDPYEGLAKYDEEANGNDIGSDYTDGKVYSYTEYESKYGSYKGKGTPKEVTVASSSSDDTGLYD